MITSLTIWFLGHTVVPNMLYLGQRCKLTLHSAEGFWKAAFSNDFLMMVHVGLNMGTNTKQNNWLSQCNNPQPLGFTEDPLSRDISTQLAVSLKTMAFNYL